MNSSKAIGESRLKGTDADISPDAIKLHESENAWKPFHKRKFDSDERERLRQFVQGVLNKLTFQKFKILLKQLEQVEMNTEEKLSLFVDLIFENAIYEPHFSVLYANLCKHLENIKVVDSKKSDSEISILSLMVEKCKDTFCGTSVKDSGKSRDVSQNCEYEYKKFRLKKFGAIRLFGELYKLDVPIGNMVNEIIVNYLQKQDEESLECLTLLLKTTGKVLEQNNFALNDPNLNSVDEYFIEIQKIIDENMLSNRIKFNLLDLIELKENHWIPRRMESFPRTIDQIHKEVKYEKCELQNRSI